MTHATNGYSRTPSLWRSSSAPLCIIKDEDNQSIRLLTNWFTGYLKSLYQKGTRIDNDRLLDKITSPMEVKQMFATKMKEYGEELRKEGKIPL